MTSFRFVAPEYYHRQKTTDWYWTVGIIAVSVVATAVILNNILFAILLIIGTVSLLMHASRPPKEHGIEIGNDGVVVGRYRFIYASLESFWLEHGEFPRLLLKSKRHIMPHIVIPVENLNEDEKEQIREFLKTKIPEEEQTEPLLEQVMEYIGF